MECIYCKKKFKSKSSLLNHTKTAKFCLKIQEQEQNQISTNQDENIIHNTHEENNEENNEEEEDEEYTNKMCKFCDTVFTHPDSIPEHFHLVCKVQFKEHQQRFCELNKENDKLSIENTTLKERNNKLELLIQNQQNIDKLQNEEIVTIFFQSSLQKIKDCINAHFNYDYVIGGQQGVARFIKEYLLTVNDSPVYLCVDMNKFIFQFINEKGDILKDPSAKLLTKLLWEADIFQKVHKLSVLKFLDMNPQELKNSLIYYEEIRNMENDNEIFRESLINLL